jgi:hypothetical protein
MVRPNVPRPTQRSNALPRRQPWAKRTMACASHAALASLDVPLGLLRHQCEYELRSRFIGLRQAFLRAGGAPGTAHALTAGAAGASATLFRHLLSLRGQAHPEDRDALARTVAAAYGVDPVGLDAPFTALHQAAPDEATARQRFGAYLAALENLIRAVDADSPR